MTPVLAHAGHWLVQVAYLAPLAVLVAILIANQLRERRARRAARRGAPGPAAADPGRERSEIRPGRD